MGGFVGDVLGGIGDAVGGVVEGVGDLLGGAVDVVQDVAKSDLGKAALLATGAYFGAPYLMGTAGGTAAATGATGGGLLGTLGTATGADLALAYDMGAIGAAGAGGFAPAAAAAGASTGGSMLSGALDWAKSNPLQAASLGLTAAKTLGGSNQPTSSTTSTSIDPDMKAAYLQNLAEARATAAGLGPRQFAAFPEYSTNMVQRYMNPYEDTVVQNALSDIERQRKVQMAQEGAQATAARAFGGSRQGVQRALVDEAALRQSGALAAQLRQQGFTQAQNLALQQEALRQAYEQQRLDATRNLGLERLNIASGALGLQPANLGSTQTSPLYRNTSASALGGALSGATLGRMIGGTANPDYALYGALGGGLLGLL